MHAGRCPTCQMAQMTRFRKSLRQASAGGLWSSSCESWVQLWDLMYGFGTGYGDDHRHLMGILAHHPVSCWQHSAVLLATSRVSACRCKASPACCIGAILPVRVLCAASRSAACLS